MEAAREGITQEQFEQKVNNSRRKVAEILGRCITPRGKGYKAVRGQAWKEFAAMMPPDERETR